MNIQILIIGYRSFQDASVTSLQNVPVITFSEQFTSTRYGNIDQNLSFLENSSRCIPEKFEQESIGDGDIFLRMSRQNPDYDRFILQNVLDMVREYTWGLKMHIIVQNLIQPDSKEAKERATSWLRAAFYQRVQNILSVPFDGRRGFSKQEDFCNELEHAWNRAKERSHIVSRIGKTRFYFQFPKVLSQLEQWLKEISFSSILEKDDSGKHDFVIFGNPESALASLSRLNGKDHTILMFDSDPNTILRRECKTRNIEIVQCQNWSELLYFALSLTDGGCIPETFDYEFFYGPQ